MIQTFALKDNYSIQIISDTWEKTIDVNLIDDVNNINILLATWYGGKWKSDSPVSLNKMFYIMKQYPKVKRITKKVFQMLKTNQEPSQMINKRLKYFKRKLTINFYNIFK
jgi:hypothetical protein